MATGSSAYSAKAGYNQAGGGYYIIITDITAGQLNTYTAGTGSGGATTQGGIAAATLAELPGGLSTLFGAGRIVKDMGKTVVSAGRTFRKIAAVLPTNANSSPTFGVAGTAATTSNPGYATYYVETGRDGANADSDLVRIARYF
jgi:hypothetical protein